MLRNNQRHPRITGVCVEDFWAFDVEGEMKAASGK
jgi:hypothetical protein